MIETVVIIAVVVIVAALIGLFVVQRRRRTELRRRFGTEYDRAVARTASERAAERELRQHQREHEHLQIREFTKEEGERYASAWTAIQTRFVDDPIGAIADADQLLSKAMREVGYPNLDADDAAMHLTLEHGQVVERFRAGHLVAELAEKATTEELRRAMHDYRSVMDSLMSVDVRGKHERAQP